MVEAGCVAGRLDVHPEIDDVDENLRVPLGLHVSTHQPEREPGFAVFGHEARNDRVERPLMRLEAVGTRLKNPDRRVRCEGLAGGGHAVSGNYARSALVQGPGWPIVSHDSTRSRCQADDDQKCGQVRVESS
jgi:hypothetical protein